MKLLGVCCLTGILAVAAYSDYAEYRVSNSLIVSGWFAGFCIRIYESGISGIAYWCIGTVLVIGVLGIFYLLRMFGAGDVKLMSVIGGFTGLIFSLKVFAAAVLISGVMSVIRCIHFGFLLNRLHYFAEYVSEFIRNRKITPYYVKERDGEAVIIPFSVAIALGFIVVRIIESGW